MASQQVTSREGDKKFTSSSIFLDKVGYLQRCMSTIDKRKYMDIKNEYCKYGKKGLFRIFANKKIRQVAVQEASLEGDVQILKKWNQYHISKKNSYSYFKRDIQKKWIQCIIKNENLTSLQWWYQNQPNLLYLYISDIQIEACKQGTLYVLNWCKQKDDLEWEMQALEDLSNSKTLKTLDWWYENKEWTQLLYREQVIDHICGYGETDQLQWFHDMRDEIEMKYTTLTIENACKQENVHVLNWWYYMQNDLEMRYDEQAIEQACKNQKDNIIRWWVSKPELTLKYNKESQFVKKYLNILRYNKFQQSETDDICQVCHYVLKNKQVFECCECKKQLDQNCYKKLKENNIIDCPNCKSQFFI